MKRQLKLNNYNTAEDGLFTLTSLKITKASQVQNFVSVPGRFAPLDLSTSLTDGQPYYGSARLEAVLESSEGTRDERIERISRMVNQLDGYTATIIHPDHPKQYMTGRLQVIPDYNNLVHCRVKLSAVCEAWLYNREETTATVNLTTNKQTVALKNKGRLSVAPIVKVTGSATLTYNEYTATLSAGTYTLPWLCLTPGEHLVEYSGTGSVTFTYREAVLAE